MEDSWISLVPFVKTLITFIEVWIVCDILFNRGVHVYVKEVKKWI